MPEPPSSGLPPEPSPGPLMAVGSTAITQTVAASVLRSYVPSTTHPPNPSCSQISLHSPISHGFLVQHDT